MRKIIKNYITFFIAVVGFIGGLIWGAKAEWEEQEPIILLIVSFIELIGFALLYDDSETDTKPFQKIYVSGDIVYGDKMPKVEKEAFLDIYDSNSKPNPYFRYENNSLDFQYVVNAVGDSIAYIVSTTFTLVQFKDGLPIDFKIFETKKLTGDDLIHKDKPHFFGKQNGNLPIELLNNLFIVIDVKYLNQDKSSEKILRKIYSIDIKYVNRNIPQASAEQYSLISKYLSEQKNTLGITFKLND
ncbi:hypothetical protein [Flavobacterium sp.]|jgi:hypothetical protein|uniref:hypothetical protein n=1 Tax=Flavobacterium sp. TaxID=239 RepID=UPI0037BF3178